MVRKYTLIREPFIVLPISIAHLVVLTSAVRNRYRVLLLMTKYYLHHSIFGISGKPRF